MARKPNGYYTVLVGGAIVRLHQLGNANPTSGDAFRLLVELELIDGNDQNARAACGIARKSAPVRSVHDALNGAARDKQ